jgi:diguanylate cyclase (GGDEF)-like protein
MNDGAQTGRATHAAEAGLKAPLAGPAVKPAVLLLGALALGIVVATDYLTAYELRLSTLYILVLLGVAWFCGPWWGGLFACLAAFAQVQIGLAAGTTFSEPLYFYVSHGNRLFVYLLIVFLVAVVRSNHARLHAAARIDGVTGVANSTAFHESVQVEMARHRRSRQPFAVAFLDCDYFKVVNEGLGRSEGDRVLQTIGQVLEGNLRQTDTVARLGGDEFALIFPHADEGEAVQVVRKLCAALEAEMSRHDWPLTFSVGVGVGVFPRIPASADEVVGFCERIMQRVKAAGKNRIMARVFDPDEIDSIQRPPLRVVR